MHIFSIFRAFFCQNIVKTQWKFCGTLRDTYRWGPRWVHVFAYFGSLLAYSCIYWPFFGAYCIHIWAIFSYIYNPPPSNTITWDSSFYCLQVSFLKIGSDSKTEKGQITGAAGTMNSMKNFGLKQRMTFRIRRELLEMGWR
jgi:hypothetical protein